MSADIHAPGTNNSIQSSTLFPTVAIHTKLLTLRRSGSILQGYSYFREHKNRRRPAASQLTVSQLQHRNPQHRSPFEDNRTLRSTIAKAGSPVGDIRLINDYSIPHGQSVNDFTDRSNYPSISYNPPRDIAKRIHHLSTSHVGECILMMLGDVAGAFRHLPIHADSVHMFSFIFDNLLVIDLACGFGWCGSPAFYSLAGTIINARYEHGNRLTRQFTGNVWCDDHTCIEVDVKTRCTDANISLRQAMATVLGPTAINELKCKTLGCCGTQRPQQYQFQPINSQRHRHGPTSCLQQGRHHAPPCLRQSGAYAMSRAAFRRPGRSSDLSRKRPHDRPSGGRALSQSSLDDLRWFVTILYNPQHFNSIPVIYFADASAPQYHVFMDASGDGLCTLEPSLKTYIRQPFSREDIRDNSHQRSTT
ncbi:unnamed protein product [Phytophthora fragariaefolia]|uniref:Unnamed protein product n=1 Tax=Phytophthora fragariaefolia TaxID=1490495 RepID=A0A9W6U1N3_9STRA|nr:unnamed protein product [Phytophthora fragariaefolia]